MMTSMIKSPNPNSDSDDSGTPLPSHSKSTVHPSLKRFKGN